MDGIVQVFEAHELLMGYSRRTVERRTATVRLWQAAHGLHGDRDDLEAFLAARPAPETRRAYLCDLRRFYGWAVRRGHLETDPTEGIETPRVPTRAPSPLTAGEVVRLRAVCESHEQRLAVALMLYAGLRASECAHLAERDLDLDRRVLTVRQGKGGKDRRVPIAPPLAELLAEGVLRASTRHQVYDVVKGRLRAAGIEARPHDLRHTFGTELARRSAGNMQLVAVLMGHASLNTTRRYVGWTPEGADVVAGLFAA